MTKINHSGAKRLDLKGSRYGNLQVLEPAENIGQRTAWKCRCICGREVTVLSKYLREGKTKSCGCLRSPKGIEKLHYIDGTCLELIATSKIRKNNTSGITGVFEDANRWRAEICFQGKRYYLGRFKEKEDAVDSRNEMKKRLIREFLKTHKEDMEGFEKDLLQTGEARRCLS